MKSKGLGKGQHGYRFDIKFHINVSNGASKVENDQDIARFGDKCVPISIL